ncbi:hypothetical protein Taro_036304 [Colocasia esculenta]|uniref:SP-RING-type domain-containing protein n=1 Tax=Colocasia esculenta TaxID=4460 RepID=A0A843W2Q7_COLES|nr:hypothetical protein [Colocasia esculenta]
MCSHSSFIHTVPKSHGWGKRNTIGRDGVAKIIDDTYRKMQVPGSTDSASKSHSGSDLNYVKPKEEFDDSKLDLKTRCLCGNTLVTDSMIKVREGKGLGMGGKWLGTVAVHTAQYHSAQLQRLGEGVPGLGWWWNGRPVAECTGLCTFVPRWCLVDHLGNYGCAPPCHDEILGHSGTSGTPSKVDFSRSCSRWVLCIMVFPKLVWECAKASIPQTMEKTFQLSRADRDMLQKTEYDLQVWCILLNDKVPFRMQWPQYSDLVVNGIPIRTTNRPGNQLLGINGRDDGPVITTCSREGINKINFTRSDTRIFCFGLRIAKRRNIQQVLNLIPKETEGERFEDALARVCRCIGGGADAENADSDSDLEVVAESVTVNLRCPMSGSRMKIAGRFKPCIHMGCFDLETFVELNQRSRKWQCPICLKNYSLENIIVDPYFNRITSLLQDCGEDLNEIDVKADGSWRVKGEGETLTQWRLPDGTLQPFTDPEVKSDSEFLKQSKQDGTGLRLGIKRNRNGIWEVSNKHNDMTPPSSENHAPEKFENQCPKILPLSVSANGSYRDGDDASVNQEGRGHFDFSASNGQELDSMNFDMMYNVDERVPLAPSRDTDVIVLSDSEEDNITLISPETAYDTGPSNGTGIPFATTHPGVQEPYLVDPALNAGGSCLGLFGNGEDFEMPGWFPSCSQPGAGFQLFNTDADVPGSLVDSHHNALGCSPMNGYGLASDGVVGDTSQTQDVTTCPPNDHHHHHEGLTCQSRIGPSACQSSAEVNNSLVDNPLAFAGDDPSLQIFLPTQPAGMPTQSDLNQQLDISNGAHTDDWISLRLGGNDTSHVESTAADGLNSRNFFGSKDDRMNSLANTASLLLSMNDDRSNRGASNNQRSDSSFSHSQQQRSVRPRLYLSIDSD